MFSSSFTLTRPGLSQSFGLSAKLARGGNGDGQGRSTHAGRRRRSSLICTAAAAAAATTPLSISRWLWIWQAANPSCFADLVINDIMVLLTAILLLLLLLLVTIVSVAWEGLGRAERGTTASRSPTCLYKCGNYRLLEAGHFG